MKERIWASLDPFIEGGREILGRSNANKSFIEALFQADPFKAYHFFLADEGQKNLLAGFVRERYPALLKDKRLLLALRTALPRGLRQNGYHCFHLSDCINYPAHLAALRNRLSDDIFPITGTTHSLSYARFAKEFLAHLWPGCTTRDAVIATSNSAVQVVGAYYAQLKRNYGITHFRQPRIARIPLGVDHNFYKPACAAEREELRREMNFEPEQCVFMIFGRISIYSKMDILPIFRACGRLIRKGLDKKRLVIVVAGFCNDDQTYSHILKKTAANSGIDLRMEINPSDERKRKLYQAVDALVSISDNVQETFGLVILEGLASGLPVIASDFDGYRDLITHRRDGLLVPTIGPATTTKIDDLAHIWFDNHIHLLLAQETCVCVDALADALDTVIKKPLLAAELGRKARELAAEAYSWRHILEEHLQLWDKLRAAPLELPPAELKKITHPLHLSYHQLFAAYPSNEIHEALTLSLSETGQAVYQKRDFAVLHAGLDEFVTEQLIRKLLFLARKPVKAKSILEKLSGMEHISMEHAQYLLLFAMKHDLVEKKSGEKNTFDRREEISD